MVGAEGWVSVCANIMPRESARMFELAVDEDDRAGAWAVFRELAQVIDWLGDHLYAHGMKAAFQLPWPGHGAAPPAPTPAPGGQGGGAAGR